MNGGNKMKRKMLTKWFGFLSLIIMLLGVSVPQAAAEIIQQEKFQMDWSFIKFRDGEVKIESDFLKTSQQDVAYCLSPKLDSPNGNDLPEIGKENDLVYRVLLYGYPQKTPVELGVSTKEEAYYATQLAIWIAAGKFGIADLKPQNQQVYNLVKDLVEKASKGTEVQETYFEVVPTEQQTLKQNKNYVETSLYMIKTNAVNGRYSVQIEGASDGVQIINEKGENKNEFAINEKFKVVIPKNVTTEDLKLKVNAKLQNLQAVTFDGKQKVQNTTALLLKNIEKSSNGIVVKGESLGFLEIKENEQIVKHTVQDKKVIEELKVTKVNATYEGPKEIFNVQNEDTKVQVKNSENTENNKQFILPSTGAKFSMMPFVGLGFIVLGFCILTIRKKL